MMRVASLGASLARAVLIAELIFGAGWIGGNLFQALILTGAIPVRMLLHV